MNAIWKPTADHLRAIRAKAAECYSMKPNQLILAPGYFFPVNFLETSERPDEPSMNRWAWGQAIETDLYDNGTTLTELKRDGVEMNDQGKAYVDFYVYTKTNHGYGIEPGELLGNVSATVEQLAHAAGRPWFKVEVNEA